MLTDQDPEKIAGLVMVDAAHHDLLEAVEPDGNSIRLIPNGWLDVLASAEQVKAADDVVDVPLYVLAASEIVEHDDAWLPWQEELATLSTSSYHTTVNSSYRVYVDNPNAIAAGVALVVRQLG